MMIFVICVSYKGLVWWTVSILVYEAFSPQFITILKVGFFAGF